MRISYNTITYNRLDRFWFKVLPYKEYFDEIRIIDTSKNKDVEGFCNIHGFTYISFDMSLNIMDAHNCWIEACKESGDSWAVWTDSDEWLGRDFLRNMRKWAEESNDGKNYNVIKAPSYEMCPDLPINRPYESNVKALKEGKMIPWFEKEPMFKMYPTVRMEGLSHPNLVGIPKRYKHIPYGYYHSKTIKENGESAVVFCFNAVVTNHQEVALQNYNHSREELNFLKDFFTGYKLDTVKKFREFLNRGKIPDDFKKFILACKDTDKYEKNAGLNNSRLGWFILYFGVLHPEECPEEHRAFFKDNFIYKVNNRI